MPRNPATGKTDRRNLSPTSIQEFRVNQTKELRAGAEKGKQRASDPDTENPEDSPPVPSPLAGLSGLGSLTLESAGSSVGNTPCDSPAALSQPSTTEGPSPALPPAPTARRTSRRKAGIYSFTLSVTLPLSILQALWLKYKAHHAFSRLPIGKPRILGAMHPRRATMEVIPPGLLHWRQSRTS